MLATGYGLVPNLELPRLVGCTIAQTASSPAALSRRACRASTPPASSAGSRASTTRSRAAPSPASLPRGARSPSGSSAGATGSSAFGERLARAFALRDELRRLARPDTVVCRCEDVACGRLDGFASAREAKLATRAGMGPCQGRVCGPALAFLRGWPVDSIRPPLFPTSVAVLEDGQALDLVGHDVR